MSKDAQVLSALESGVSQCDAILAEMRRGTMMTPLYAFQQFGTLALHSRISELRERGYRIVCKMQHDGKKHWGEYWIEEAV